MADWLEIIPATQMLNPPNPAGFFMIDQGYRYEPVEVNERVRYFWLIGTGPESQMPVFLKDGV